MRVSRLSRRDAVRLAALALLASAILALAGTAYLLRDPVPRILARRSHVTGAVESTPVVADGHSTQDVRVTAASGLEVDMLVRRPAAAGERMPVVIVLGGRRTGADAATLIGDTHGTVVAALDYPYRGDTRLKGLEVVRHVPAIRGALLDTPPALMIALDYLLARPDVDPERVEMVGASLGLPFVCVAAALDERVTRVWSVHGAAHPYTLMNHQLRRSIPFAPARALVAGLANVAASGPRLAPERWCGRVAPRPFLMINAEADEQLPRHAIEALYESALEPREIIWLPGQHVHPKRTEVIRGLVQTVLARVVDDAPRRD